MSNEKEFKTIEEQLDILKSRGLTVEDEAKAKKFLINNNYYRIIDIYNFDHELRHILLKYLEIIEVRFKSIYSYEFTNLHGSIGYLNESNFIDSDIHKRIMDKTEEQKEKRLPHEAYLKHFIKELKQPIPLWAYVDLMTIADVSLMYSITEDSIKNKIAAHFNVPAKILGKFMHSLTIVRNLCAHGSRLYNRLFEQKPKLSKDERKLLNTLKNGNKDDAHLFSFILVMKRMLSGNDFDEMKKDIMELEVQYPFVNLRYYGFRSDWSNIV